MRVLVHFQVRVSSGFTGILVQTYNTASPTFDLTDRSVNLIHKVPNLPEQTVSIKDKVFQSLHKDVTLQVFAECIDMFILFYKRIHTRHVRSPADTRRVRARPASVSSGLQEAPRGGGDSMGAQ